MHQRVMTLAVLIGFIVAGQAAAQAGAPQHPCSLLTGAQISAALGSVGESREGDMPGSGHGSSPLRRACSWSIPPGGLFTLSVGKVPDAKMTTRQLLDYMNSMYDMLKSQGWKYEKKDLGSTSCSMLTPPAGASGMPATLCGTVVRGMLVLTGTSTKTSVPAEKLKTLTETAASRLP